MPVLNHAVHTVGLGLGFSLRAARVHTHHIYIPATCKRHVEKELTEHRISSAKTENQILKDDDK